MASNTAPHPFLFKPGEGEILVKSGMRLKVGSAQTNGTFELLEIEGLGGPPPHVHQDHDECFYIIQGSYIFTLGAEEVEASAGSIVFVPRGARHAFRHGEGARALVFVLPANLEGFFRELGEGLAAGRSEADLRSQLAARYDAKTVK